MNPGENSTNNQTPAKEAPPVPRGKRLLLGSVALIVAAGIWFPSVHFFYSSDVEQYFSEEGLAPKARLMAARHLQLWTDPELKKHELANMRARNAEWDFMGRTFLVLALANMGFREPERKEEFLKVIDEIIDETIRLEAEEGIYFFLMPYARDAKFLIEPVRSHFLDGEIALMLGVRRMLEEKEEYKAPLKERVDVMIERMRESPVLSAESYPNECWIFCNTVSLAAIKVFDFLEGTDHSDFFREWLETAKEELIDPQSGLLVASYTVYGHHLQGGEGSSIWMAAHCLEVIDETFAKEQYERAKEELGRRLLGFGWAREWPKHSRSKAMDVDSGPIIPVLEVSTASSGLAFVAASSFGDTEFLSGLLASLNLGGFPVKRKRTLRYCASNQVGDAVMLYSMTLGPIWDKLKAM